MAMSEQVPKASFIGSLRPSGAALVLAGAAGKGPFAAGALSVLAEERRLNVRVVAGASSGALNAAVYAAGLRAGAPDEAATMLTELWQKEASIPRILPWSARKKLVLNALRHFAMRRTIHSELKLR